VSLKDLRSRLWCGRAALRAEGVIERNRTAERRDIAPLMLLHSQVGSSRHLSNLLVPSRAFSRLL